MERLTSKRSWEAASKDLVQECGYSHIWKRLNLIEDILGDTYDLERLRELVWQGLGESVTESNNMEPVTLEQLRQAPHGKIKDETLQHICDRANEISADPPRLNREAWEPCSRCGVKVCENCFYGNTPACSECENCYRESNWKPESKYCPGCGRPLTDEAWAMLEKRLEGTINEKCL